MKPKLRHRVLRNLKAAITEAESLYDNVRDADETTDDRTEALGRVKMAAKWLEFCKDMLTDDLRETP